MKATNIRIWGIEEIRLAPFYFNALRLKYALEALDGVKGRVLEIGCGSGAFARAIKRNRPDLSILGCDVSRSAVLLAKKLDGDISFHYAKAERLPFKSSSFDAVLAFDVIEHLKEPSSAFSEMRRVLKANGVLHCAIPLEGSLYTVHGLMLLVGVKPKEIYAGHAQKFKTGEIERMLKANGFYHIKCDFSGHLFYQIMDFTYFFARSIAGRKPIHTVEGYLETIPPGIERFFLTFMKFSLAVISYFESVYLKSVPGQIGHFSAVRK